MVDRCTNPESTSWPDYGGRGITVCNRWRESFEDFLADVGRLPSKAHTLERSDNDQGYMPGNCKWATRKENNRNRRNNLRITFNGETACLADWAERLGIASGVLQQRIDKLGWPVGRAFTTPVRTLTKRDPAPASNGAPGQ